MTTRTNESGAYLGCIGTMLTNSDICTACGQVHEAHQFTFKHGGSRSCPEVVIGSFPILTRPPVGDEVIMPLQRRADEEPVYPGVQELLPRAPLRRVALLGAAWPLPSPEEEYF
jgi:hypothetical protein